MAKSDNTASFLLRFTQRIFEDEQGEANVQWRGKISHVQGNDQKNFVELKDAMEFIQQKLSELTLAAVEGSSPEEKEGILNKSMDIWKRLANNYPKILLEAIKDPKGQVTQIQEQLSSKAEQITNRLDLDAYRPTSKSDIEGISEQITLLTKAVGALQKKVESMDKKLKKS